MKLENTVINFLGDSITQGYGASAGARFSDLIEKRCHLKRANNYGLCGTRFAKQTAPSSEAYYDYDFCQRCLEMDPEADIIFVFGGCNDFFHGDAPFGTPDDRTPDTFWGACYTLMRTIIETYPNAVTVFATPLHAICEDELHGVQQKPMSAYVDAIRTMAGYFSIPVLDLNRMSGLQPAVPAVMERLMPDGIHPNDAGQSLLADRIIGFLQAL